MLTKKNQSLQLSGELVLWVAFNLLQVTRSESMGNLGPKSEVHGNFLVEEMRSHVNQYSIFVNILLLLTFCIECLYCNITDDFTVSK